MSVLGPISVALVAGVLSFTSPCCLPLMPGYLGYVSGVTSDSHDTVAVRRRAVGTAVLFVLGFALVFTLLGATASAAGGFLLRNRIAIERVGGVLVIVMGLATAGVLRIPLLYREARMDLRRVPPGPLGAMPLGMAFAIGWTPCVGPVLTAILAAAASTQTVWTGAGLLLVYSLGLGIPFVLLALGHSWASRTFGWLRRNGRLLERVGGALLVGMGSLMIAGLWTRLFAPLLRVFAEYRWPPI